jgi:SAM-dependent methyltransferase
MIIVEKFAHKISQYNRRRKWHYFTKLVDHKDHIKILDVGFSENEYAESDNYIEKYYPYPEKITALGIDKPIKFCERYPRVKTVIYDGGTFPLIDNIFDLCWSNAVLEHVGSRKQQLIFLQEIKRVSKSAFITTPNKHFPIEVHTRVPFIHFLPKRFFDKLLVLIGKEWATGNYMNLLSLQDLKNLLYAAGIKEYKIIKNKFIFFTIDFIIIF